MVIIDQHALHERVLYEQLKDKMASQALESQRLLVPEPVTLPSREIAALVEAKEFEHENGADTTSEQNPDAFGPRDGGVTMRCAW